MAITQAIANNFKKLLLEGDSNFSNSSGDKYKLALYTSSATLNSATTSFTTSGEVANTGTYASGGDLARVFSVVPKVKPVPEVVLTVTVKAPLVAFSTIYVFSTIELIISCDIEIFFS